MTNIRMFSPVLCMWRRLL